MRSVADGRGVPINVSNAVTTPRDAAATPDERPAADQTPAPADARVALAR